MTRHLKQKIEHSTHKIKKKKGLEKKKPKIKGTLENKKTRPNTKSRIKRVKHLNGDTQSENQKNGSLLLENMIEEKGSREDLQEKREEPKIFSSHHETPKDELSHSPGISEMAGSPEKFSLQTLAQNVGEPDSEDHKNQGRDPQENEDKMNIQKEYLSFILSDEEYAIDIMMIKEIIKPVEITQVPRAPEIILGIISLRGTILPIFNLRKRLGLKDFDQNRRARIVVISSENGLVGLMVDAVTGVVKMFDSDIEPPPSVLNDIETVFVKGVGRYQDRFIIFMEITKVLSGDVILSDEEKVSA